MESNEETCTPARTRRERGSREERGGSAGMKAGLRRQLPSNTAPLNFQMPAVRAGALIARSPAADGDSGATDWRAWWCVLYTRVRAPKHDTTKDRGHGGVAAASGRIAKIRRPFRAVPQQQRNAGLCVDRSIDRLGKRFDRPIVHGGTRPLWSRLGQAGQPLIDRVVQSCVCGCLPQRKRPDSERESESCRRRRCGGGTPRTTPFFRSAGMRAGAPPKQAPQTEFDSLRPSIELIDRSIDPSPSCDANCRLCNRSLTLLHFRNASAAGGPKENAGHGRGGDDGHHQQQQQERAATEIVRSFDRRDDDGVGPRAAAAARRRAGGCLGFWCGGVESGTYVNDGGRAGGGGMGNPPMGLPVGAVERQLQ